MKQISLLGIKNKQSNNHLHDSSFHLFINVLSVWFSRVSHTKLDKAKDNKIWKCKYYNVGEQVLKTRSKVLAKR